jgi:hypothetical protein
VPRPNRLALAGCAHRIIQRRNNRQAVFFADADRRFYLERLGVALAQERWGQMKTTPTPFSRPLFPLFRKGARRLMRAARLREITVTWRCSPRLSAIILK